MEARHKEHLYFLELWTMDDNGLFCWDCVWTTVHMEYDFSWQSAHRKGVGREWCALSKCSIHKIVSPERPEKFRKPSRAPLVADPFSQWLWGWLGWGWSSTIEKVSSTRQIVGSDPSKNATEHHLNTGLILITITWPRWMCCPNVDFCVRDFRSNACDTLRSTTRNSLQRISCRKIKGLGSQRWRPKIPPPSSRPGSGEPKDPGDLRDPRPFMASGKDMFIPKKTVVNSQNHYSLTHLLMGMVGETDLI